MSYPINYRGRDFLLKQISNTLAFYDPRAVDPAGGFYHCYLNNGEIFDPGLRTLVASCRFVFNYAKAYRQFGKAEYRANVLHGLRYLREVHRNPQTGGYAWRIKDGCVVDATNHCYGLAFVLLAYACAADVGVAEAVAWMAETDELMERRFWLDDQGLVRLRGRRRLEAPRLSRPERQHARLRGDDRRLRSKQGAPLPRPRLPAGKERHAKTDARHARASP